MVEISIGFGCRSLMCGQLQPSALYSGQSHSVAHPNSGDGCEFEHALSVWMICWISWGWKGLDRYRQASFFPPCSKSGRPDTITNFVFGWASDIFPMSSYPFILGMFTSVKTAIGFWYWGLFAYSKYSTGDKNNVASSPSSSIIWASTDATASWSSMMWNIRLH